MQMQMLMLMMLIMLVLVLMLLAAAVSTCVIHFLQALQHSEGLCAVQHTNNCTDAYTHNTRVIEISSCSRHITNSFPINTCATFPGFHFEQGNQGSLISRVLIWAHIDGHYGHGRMVYPAPVLERLRPSRVRELVAIDEQTCYPLALPFFQATVHAPPAGTAHGQSPQSVCSCRGPSAPAARLQTFRRARSQIGRPTFCKMPLTRLMHTHTNTHTHMHKHRQSDANHNTPAANDVCGFSLPHMRGSEKQNCV